MSGPAEGQKAPDFELAAEGDETLRLSDFEGRKLVLYFYPKDDTPGCTKEAIAFTEHSAEFAAADTDIVGVSKDSVAKHGKFREKHELGIHLGSDPDGEVIERYGSWVEKKMYGRTYMGIDRSTFLIDREGKVAKIWRKVRVKGHVEEVLEAARALD
ncbi:peroxiredoxin [Pacificimonas flava]|uniref:thioredoxin-dependent peroxiredoxin n=2 Tax=Pacificimonas TaxID=1960290 RepID=A0A219B1S2_9SPHN|nr:MULTISPECIES: peroxiredoxin [Pacificimonas]MBZ6378319.1 peroxiredoxin [Pacificimonas aurantium]OWV32073.1 peroxiredoxin [Pacificimonas flava]